MTTLRVFPTWSDFQPIVEVHANSAGWNKSKDTRMTLDELRRPDTPAGYAGVDETMLQRFEAFCDLAEKHGMKLVVAIMTGQMTFRNFIPPALENRDPAGRAKRRASPGRPAMSRASWRRLKARSRASGGCATSTPSSAWRIRRGP